MIRIDFGTLYEFEREDNNRRRENRKKIQDFLSLCETHQATIVEQRDWNTRDLIHFLGISPDLVFTITISEKYLGVQTSQIREKFQTFQSRLRFRTRQARGVRRTASCGQTGPARRGELLGVREDHALRRLLSALCALRRKAGYDGEILQNL